MATTTTAERFFKQDLKFFGDFEATPTGDLALEQGIENLKQAILHRIITVPGTLLHRPTYGIGLPSYQGSLDNLATRQDLMRAMQEQFSDDPRVQELTSLDFRNEMRDGKMATVITLGVLARGGSNLSVETEL